MNYFNTKLVENLKREDMCLESYLIKTREKDDFVEYKNLINSYKEEVKLINELENSDTKPIQ